MSETVEHFHVSKASCLRLAKMLYDVGVGIKEIEETFEWSIDHITDGKIVWKDPRQGIRYVKVRCKRLQQRR